VLGQDHGRLLRDDVPVQPLAHGYSHDTRSDGSIVVKRHQGPSAEARRSTEQRYLSRLAGLVPVPRLITEPSGPLRMEHVGGVHGQELVAAGHGAAVLRSCGRMLRQIQSIDVAVVFPEMPHVRGSVVVHGDYGPNNMLFDPTTFAVTAVLDWEWGHVGDPVEDPAWCEWIIRMHHPESVGALDELFAGYGDRPSWAQRRAASSAKCRSMLAMDRVGGASAPGAQRWQRNLDIMESWIE
jgi:tRNA A-37 threonylcarbamoyl transferase component Bud32